MQIRPKSTEGTLSGSVLLSAALIIAVIMVAVYFVGAQFRDDAATENFPSKFPVADETGADIDPDPDKEDAEPDTDGGIYTDSDSDADSESEFESDSVTETETDWETESETETETETETAPPETTTAPPETTTKPPKTTTKPPETTTAPPETTTTSKPDPEPEPTESLPVYVDGTLVTLFEATYVNGVAYAPVCAFASAVDANEHSVSDNGDTAKVKADGISLSASVKDPYITANGRIIPFAKSGKPKSTVTSDNGKVIAPISALAKAFACTVKEKDDGIYISCSDGYIKSADDFYDSDALYLISHIVYLEAGNESFNGKLAVASVIMNRVNSAEFPDTVHGVVYQENQFTVVDSSRFDEEPNADSVIAAKMVLEGYTYDKRIMFFNSTGTGWPAENRNFMYKLGGHYFYD